MEKPPVSIAHAAVKQSEVYLLMAFKDADHGTLIWTRPVFARLLVC